MQLLDKTGVVVFFKRKAGYFKYFELLVMGQYEKQFRLLF